MKTKKQASRSVLVAKAIRLVAKKVLQHLNDELEVEDIQDKLIAEYPDPKPNDDAALERAIIRTGNAIGHAKVVVRNALRKASRVA